MTGWARIQGGRCPRPRRSLPRSQRAGDSDDNQLHSLVLAARLRPAHRWLCPDEASSPLAFASLQLQTPQVRAERSEHVQVAAVKDLKVSAAAHTALSTLSNSLRSARRCYAPSPDANAAVLHDACLTFTCANVRSGSPQSAPGAQVFAASWELDLDRGDQKWSR